MFKVVPLFSGSAGNCTYIKYGNDEILVDAGVSCKQIQTALESIGTGLQNIKGIFITHEHSDHIKGLEVITKKYGIPVYINSCSLEGMEKESARDIVQAVSDVYGNIILLSRECILAPENKFAENCF